MAEAKRESSGVPGLDELIKGGFPQGSVILLRGGPGSGKTTFALQFLIEGIKNGVKGLYISLEESVPEIIRGAENFGWDLSEVLKKELLRIESVEFKRTPGYIRSLSPDNPPWSISVETSSKKGRGISGQFNSETFSELLKTLVDDSGAGRVVMDSLSMFSSQFNNEGELRFETIELVKTLSSRNCTTLVTAQSERKSGEEFKPEEYLSHGVIDLHYIQQGNSYIMAAHVLKMRNSDHDREFRPYAITKKGVVVYP
ncbi:MAG: hypothetical protein CVT48_04060, partial [Thermoplasmata archaeon HGW-Thermoplasmata-1]